MNKDLNIKLDGWLTANLDFIRDEASVEKYAGTAGLKEFVKIRYNAKLNVGVYGITSITFKDVTSKEYIEFKDRHEKDQIMVELRKK